MNKTQMLITAAWLFPVLFVINLGIQMGLDTIIGMHFNLLANSIAALCVTVLSITISAWLQLRT